MCNIFLMIRTEFGKNIVSTKSETLYSVGIINNNGYAYFGIWQVLLKLAKRSTWLNKLQ